MGPDPSLKPHTVATLPQALFAGALLIFIDAFLLNQGVIAGLMGAGLLMIGLPLALLKRSSHVRALRVRNIAIYAASVVLVFFFNGLNNHIAATRAEVIISAVKAFHTHQYGHYPESLNMLAPEFIDHIPLAKYTLSLNTFHYHTTDGRTVLFYVKTPPFGRPIYRFSEDQWGYID